MEDGEIMGFQFRRRTKGKDGWLNFSYSKRNGLGMSGSVKVGNITFNTGNSKRASRTSVDLGNGLRYVSYGPSKSKKPKAQKSQPTYYEPTEFTSADMVVFHGVYWIVAILMLVLGGWIVKCVGGLLILGWIGYKYGDEEEVIPPTIEPQVTEESIYEEAIKMLAVAKRDDPEYFERLLQVLREEHDEDAVQDFIKRVDKYADV